MVEKQFRNWKGWASEETAAHLHAIGALTSGFNRLEGVLLSFFTKFIGAPSSVAAILFEKINSELSIQLLEKSLLVQGIDENVRKAILWFFKGYKACADNRNLIVHSTIYSFDPAENTLLATKRLRKDGSSRDFDFSLTDMRLVADEINEWSRFGALILWHLRRAEIEKGPLPTGWVYMGPNQLPSEPQLPNALTAKRAGFKKREER